MDRREFLIGALRAAAIGVTASLPLSDVSVATAATIERHTDIQTGNANYSAAIDEKCGSNPTGDCEARYFTGIGRIINTVVVGPAAEETLFRRAPSDLLDNVNARQQEGRVPLTPMALARREWIVGVVSTLAFGLMHNIGGDGRRRLPVQQTVAGSGLWALQRSFGFPASFAAHASINARALYQARRRGRH